MAYDKVKLTLCYHKKRQLEGESSYKIAYKGRRKNATLEDLRLHQTFLAENLIHSRRWDYVSNPASHFVFLYEMIIQMLKSQKTFWEILTFNIR